MLQTEWGDIDDESVDDLIVTVKDATVLSLTPTKRPHIVDLSSPEKQNNFTKLELSSEVVSEVLTEPESKRRKKRSDKKQEIGEGRGLEQMWRDRRFVVSKLDGHNDVICSLDCNQDLLLTGRLVTFSFQYKSTV